MDTDHDDVEHPVAMPASIRLDELIDSIKRVHPDALDQLSDAVLLGAVALVRRIQLGVS